MGKQQFVNNTKTYLASDLGSDSSTLEVTDASGLPSLGTDDWFMMAAFDTDKNLTEIFKCTAVSGSTVTIERGQEGTSAVSHTADPETTLICGLTKGSMEQFQSDIAEKCLPADNLSKLTDVGAARTNLGLGNCAEQKYTVSTSPPSGGSDGDVWYEVD